MSFLTSETIVNCLHESFDHVSKLILVAISTTCKFFLVLLQTTFLVLLRD